MHQAVVLTCLPELDLTSDHDMLRRQYFACLVTLGRGTLAASDRARFSVGLFCSIL